MTAWRANLPLSVLGSVTSALVMRRFPGKRVAHRKVQPLSIDSTYEYLRPEGRRDEWHAYTEREFQVQKGSDKTYFSPGVPERYCLVQLTVKLAIYPRNAPSYRQSGAYFQGGTEGALQEEGRTRW